jgi:PAS domain S-box-containing protein
VPGTRTAGSFGKNRTFEQLLRTVIDKTNDWIFAKDKKFSCILANKSFAQAIGKTVEEIIGKIDLELGFSEEIVLGNSAKNIRGFRADDSAVLAGEIIHNPCEQATIADGSVHIFDTQKVPLRDHEGNVFAVLAFAHDITERHEAEAALRRSESRFRSLVANIPGVVYRWKCDFSTNFISDAVYLLTGYPAADFISLLDKGCGLLLALFTRKIWQK